MSTFLNSDKPKGFKGKIVLNLMNVRNAGIANWGFKQIRISENDHCLDIGCGGGSNVKQLLNKVNNGNVIGLDYSQLSVDKSKQVNQLAIEEGRCQIIKGNVMDLSFLDQNFNLVVAFETIHFWPNLALAFQEIYQILSDGGTFMICQETNWTFQDERSFKLNRRITKNTPSEIEIVLKENGFTKIKIIREIRKGWLCITAQKIS